MTVIDELKKLCADNQKVVGEMLTYLQEANANAALAGQPPGLCSPFEGGPEFTPFMSTYAECISIPGHWKIRTPTSQEIQKFIDELPSAAIKAVKRLNQLYKENKEVQNLMKLLQDANKERPGEIGICRLKNGDCFPGTKKECEQGGGVWTYIQQFQPQKPKG